MGSSFKKEMLIEYNTMITKKTIEVISIITIVGGIFGMLFSFPYLWNSNLAGVVGAGFPFVGGAILAAAGLISLALNTKEKKQ